MPSIVQPQVHDLVAVGKQRRCRWWLSFIALQADARFVADDLDVDVSDLLAGWIELAQVIVATARLRCRHHGPALAFEQQHVRVEVESRAGWLTPPVWW